MSPSRHFVVSLAIAALALGACRSRGAADRAARARPLGADVLATVNGVSITEHDLEMKLKNDMHQADLRPEHRKNVLESVIRDELLAQKAAELGLDGDPKYQAGLRALQAQIDTYRRRELSDRYTEQVVAKAGAVAAADARKFFEENLVRLRTDLHLWQILVRDEAAAAEARKALQEGKPFEEVARGFSPAGATGATWDLGYVKWLTTPEPWRPVLESLKPGETSGVIRGPRGRFWILRLVEVREGPPPTFESLRPAIVDALQGGKLTQARETADRELRQKADIVYRQK